MERKETPRGRDKHERLRSEFLPFFSSHFVFFLLRKLNPVALSFTLSLSSTPSAQRKALPHSLRSLSTHCVAKNKTHKNEKRGRKRFAFTQ